MFSYSNDLTNGYGNSSPWEDTVEDYFKLETRNSFDYPQVKQNITINGRDYNIVPYNPHATGAADRQKSH